MLNENELKYIEEQLGADWRTKIEFLINEATRGKQLEAEITSNLQKIMMNPDTKKQFKSLLDKAGIKDIEVPETPFDDIYQKTKEMEKKLSSIEKMMEEKEKVYKKLEEYNITEDEYEDLIKFQKETGIADNLRAIELYAMSKKAKLKYELEPVPKISITPPKEWTEEDAYKWALGELGKIKGGLK